MRTPLWSLGRRVSEPGYPDLPLLSVYRDHGVVPREGREDNYNRAGEDLGAYQRVLPGDLVLNKMKTWQGSLGVSMHEGIVSPAYFVFRLNPALSDPKYMHHLLRSQPYIRLYGAASKGIRPQQWDLPWEAFRTITVALPVVEEQRRIADFLDEQVARLDRAIALRKQQESLLAERYSGMLDEMYDVTRDDRRAVPLRHLLGQPPCYGVLVPQFVADGVPFCRVNALTALEAGVVPDTTISSEQSLEYGRTVLTPGDVLTAVVGTLGVSAVVPESAAGANIARAVARLRPGKRITTSFLRGYLATHGYLHEAIRATESGTAQATLNMGDLARFPVGVPHSLELAARVGETARQLLDDQANAKSRLYASKALLGERKQALITLITTGGSNRS